MTTAYPFGFNIGPFPITGFGIMMMLSFLVGGWLIDRECKRLGFASDYAGDMIVGAVIGGIVGAKLWFVILHPGEPLFARGGLVFYGGLVGGTIGVIINGWRRRVPIRWTAQLAAVALPAAYAVGRVGCYVVGDDYGVPTRLPWGVRFPLGMPATTAENLRAFNVTLPPDTVPGTVFAVHPTQLYEVAVMLIAFAFIWRWRTSTRGTGWLLGAYLALAGVERFAIEFLRAKDDRLIGSLSVAQLASIVMVAVGTWLVVRLSPLPTATPNGWLLGGAARPVTG